MAPCDEMSAMGDIRRPLLIMAVPTPSSIPVKLCWKKYIPVVKSRIIYFDFYAKVSVMIEVFTIMVV